jgi:hypothetical protein
MSEMYCCKITILKTLKKKLVEADSLVCLQQQLERNQVVCTKDGYQIPTETAFAKYVSKNEEDGPVFLIDEAEEVIPSTSTVQTAPVFTPVQQQTVTAVQHQAAEASNEAFGGDEGEGGVPSVFHKSENGVLNVRIFLVCITIHQC